MMKNRLIDIEIPPQDPFCNDKLNRESFAETLITMAEMYKDSGCVIGLNGDWGSGKTTFIRMTMQKMKNMGFSPLYFNSWENDFVSDPLIALLSEIKEIDNSSDKWNKVISNGGKIVASMAGTIVKSILKNKCGIDSDAISNGIDEATDILNSELEDFSKQKKTFQEFKNSLIDYIVDNSKGNKPVVFFVDELDRCNPHFSVKVLERIKHLFDIPNLIFVLSISKKQLEYAIQGYYGSMNIDSTNYLRRFIDVELSLPIPNAMDLCTYFYEYYGFEEIFKNKERIKYNQLQFDGEKFLDVIRILIGSFNIDIRTLDKIFAHSRLVLNSFSNSQFIFPDVYFLLCFIKIIDSQLFNDIEHRKFKAQELLIQLEKFLPKTILTVYDDYDKTVRSTVFMLMKFMKMYDINPQGIEYEEIFSPHNNEGPKLNSNLIESSIFKEAYNCYSENRFPDTIISLDYLIKRINLNESLILNSE